MEFKVGDKVINHRTYYTDNWFHGMGPKMDVFLKEKTVLIVVNISTSGTVRAITIDGRYNYNYHPSELTHATEKCFVPELEQCYD